LIHRAYPAVTVHATRRMHGGGGVCTLRLRAISGYGRRMS
jgi:hypothetical protein